MPQKRLHGFRQFTCPDKWFSEDYAAAIIGLKKGHVCDVSTMGIYSPFLMSRIPPDAHRVDKLFDRYPDEFSNEYPVLAIQDNSFSFPVSPRCLVNTHPMCHFLDGEPEQVPFGTHLLTHRFGWRIRIVPQELDNPGSQVEGSPVVAFFPINNRAFRNPKAGGKLFQE